ncbi:hypothetical protein [Pseudomonas oryzihabitans]|uniref:hypothetical protein n=1 Tax=Pseudomonas oryzihabitans TaxID=47885 RepID=UPI0011A620DC|nr:hypothetical protein [Pseudomonas oryzihabitans]
MAKSAKERKADQREREAERLAALGHQVMQFEMYQRTAEALDRICAAGGFEQRAEVLTLLIHHADQIAQRDMSRFAEMVTPPRST